MALLTSKLLGRAYKLDLAQDKADWSWESIAIMPKPKSFIPVTDYQSEEIFTFCGSDYALTAWDTIEVYDVKSDVWTTLETKCYSAGLAKLIKIDEETVWLWSQLQTEPRKMMIFNLRTKTETGSFPITGQNDFWFFRGEKYVYAYSSDSGFDLVRIDPKRIQDGWVSVGSLADAVAGMEAYTANLYTFSRRRIILIGHVEGVPQWKYFDEQLENFVDGGESPGIRMSSDDQIRDEIQVWSKYLDNC